MPILIELGLACAFPSSEKPTNASCVPFARSPGSNRLCLLPAWHKLYGSFPPRFSHRIAASLSSLHVSGLAGDGMKTDPA